MANPNYTPSYNQYLTQTAGYALPSSVRTYSVFDPSSNSWKRMTNDGRSPMPVQGQTPVADALALARQTQGRDWSAQPAPVQTPVQTPLGGPRMVSKPQIGGGMGDSPSPASGVPQRASQRGFRVSGQDGLLSLGLPSAKASPAPASIPAPAVPIVPIAQGASTVVVPSKAPLTMADQHRRAAVLLGTLPNSDPTPIPSIWSGLGRFLGNGLARFALDN